MTIETRVMNAFSQSGLSSKHIIDPEPVSPSDFEFEDLFGPEPPMFAATRGGPANVHVMGANWRWHAARRRFRGIVASAEMNADMVEAVVSTTGGFPVIWEDVSGREFLAIVGISHPAFYLKPVYIQDNPNIVGDTNFGGSIVPIWTDIVYKGGCVKIPDDMKGIDTLKKRNEQNCPNAQ